MGSALVPAIDAMLRGTSVSAPTTVQAATTDVRDEATRILVGSVSNGALSDANRTYLAQVISQRAGLAPAEAEKRVNDAYAEAGRAIDNARKAAILVGLVTATALLFGLVASWYAGQRGGHHRDHNIPAKFGPFRRRVA
jgi:hypothetical protein